MDYPRDEHASIAPCDVRRPTVTEGVRLLHAAMVGDSPQYWISRLAHVQLHHYLKSLEPTIKEDRHRKWINAKQGSKTDESEIDLLSRHAVGQVNN